MNGAHRNFNRYGSATYDITPMVTLVAPASFSQACSALSVIWLGKPEAAPRNRIASILGLASTSRSRGSPVARGALKERSP